MRSWCRYIILLSGLLFPYLSVNAQSITPVQLPANWKQQGYVLQLKDELQHPDLSWPVTLLQYRLHFGNAGVLIRLFSVTDIETGKPVAFQLAGTVVKNGLLQEATLYLLADLPLRELYGCSGCRQRQLLGSFLSMPFEWKMGRRK